MDASLNGAELGPNCIGGVLLPQPACLDQFYTHPDLAGTFAMEVSDRWRDPNVLFVEPSAGDGAFVRPLRRARRNVRAMDIAPEGRGIIQGDFLCQHDLFRGRHSKIVVVGNPPFGRNASLAVQFFNRAAMSADAIAFIVPRTFRKASLQLRLNSRFHLVEDQNVQPNAFLVDGCAHDVPCAWQIWERRLELRQMPNPPSVDHLIEYTDPAGANFAMRRVGFYAGRIIPEDFTNLSRSTHYFLREITRGVMDVMKDIEWVDIAAQTAGVRSLSKREIAIELGRHCHS